MSTTEVKVSIYPDVPPSVNPEMSQAPSAPPPASYPPPQQYPPQGYPPQQSLPHQQSMPPQQSFPPQQSLPHQQSLPQQGSFPPPQQYPPPEQMQYPPPTYSGPPPTQAQPQPGTFTGLTVKDAFRQDNEIQLIARSNGRPIRVHNCKFMGNGNYADECNFRVVVTGEHTVMLQHVFFKGQWVAIHDAKMDPLSCKGKGKEYSQLKLHILPDNYVMLESAKFPGRFVNMSANGMPKPPQMVSLSDADGQFYVRVVKQNHTPSTTVYNSLGRPSILNSLHDLMLVQLTSRRAASLIRIKPSGKYESTNVYSDKETLWTLKNRGMGIVSFHNHASPGYWLRIVNNKMVGKGGETELSGDFRVLENPDGSVSFELAKTQGVFIKTDNGEKDFTLYQVSLTGSSSKPVINRVPLNA